MLLSWLVACRPAPHVQGEVRITPTHPTVRDPLLAFAVARDPDGRPVDIAWRWRVDGRLVEGATGPTLPAGTPRDSVVEVEATPVSGGRRGVGVRASTTIHNTPPGAGAAVILPPEPAAGGAVRCVSVGWLDPDGDPPSHRASWSVDGVALAPGQTPGALARGQRLSCVLVPTDGRSEGAAVRGEAVVGNAAPQPVGIEVLPTDAISGRDDLICGIAAAPDPDGDPVTVSLRWFADAIPWRGPVSTTHTPGDTISAWDTPRAGSWTCQATASDPLGASTVSVAHRVPEVGGGNLLVLLADDLGRDKVGAYGVHPDPPPTPNIDALAADGVLFRSFYTAPTCSPSRAMLLTGRYTRRYGVGTPLKAEVDPLGLPEAELLIPEMLAHAPTLTYQASLAGKWHLASFLSGPGPRHPGVEGFGWHAGSVENLHLARDLSGPLDYMRWEKDDNGVLSEHLVYATADTTADAIARATQMPEPWLLWVGYNAPHWPLHVPPEPRLTQGVSDPPEGVELADVMIESLDLAIGDLLGAMGPDLLGRTTVLFMGDNGTDTIGTAPPFDPERAKGTVHEGGVGVPLIVSGPLVRSPGTRSDALVSAVDLYSTLAAVAGVDEHALDAAEGVTVRDGVSFLPYLADPGRPSRRELVYVDKHLPVGGPPYNIYHRALHDGRYKLHRYEQSGEDWYELYDLQDRVIEGEDLLQGVLSAAEQAAFDRLRTQLEDLEQGLSYEY